MIITSILNYDKRDDFDFHRVNFPFLDWGLSSPCFLWCIHTFRNLLGLLESEINVKQQNFSSRAIGVINLEKSLSKFYHELISKFNPNLMLDIRRFYVRAFRNQNF